MVRVYGYYMTWGTLVRKFPWKAPRRRQGSHGCFVCPAKEGVDTVHTYVCFMALPGLSLDGNGDDIPSPNTHHFEAMTGRHTGIRTKVRGISPTRTAAAAHVRMPHMSG